MDVGIIALRTLAQARLTRIMEMTDTDTNIDLDLKSFHLTIFSATPKQSKTATPPRRA